MNANKYNLINSIGPLKDFFSKDFYFIGHSSDFLLWTFSSKLKSVNQILPACSPTDVDYLPNIWLQSHAVTNPLSSDSYFQGLSLNFSICWVDLR